MCELQCHGSIAVIKTLSSAIATIDGLRLAEPGEFARRAFHHGKLDLSDAESLADLIDAETELQLDQAIKGEPVDMLNSLESSSALIQQPFFLLQFRSFHRIPDPD